MNTEPTTSEPAPSGKRLIAALVAIVLLQAFVKLRFPWEPPADLARWLRPSPDLALLLLLGLLATLRWGTHRLAAHALALALIVLALHRFAATAIPAFYYQPLSLYHDVTFLPGLVHLLLHDFEPWLQTTIKVGTLVLFALLYLVVYLLTRSALGLGTRRRVALASVAVALVLGAVGLATGPLGYARLVRDVIRIPHDMKATRLYVEGLAKREAEVDAQALNVEKLAGVDVYVLFVESYGRVVFDKPDVAVLMRDWIEEWQAQLDAAGIACKSAYVTPRNEGAGSSWSHAQLLGGVPIANARQFELVIASELRPLPHAFRDAGHRTLMVQPMMEEPWPQGQAFYGFDEDVYRAFFPYDGFRYHWGHVPDQYALEYARRELVEKDETPVFLMYVSVSSHAPFSNLPPYVEDWDAVLAPGRFAGEPAAAYDIGFLDYMTHADTERAFVESIRYSLDTMTGFARRLTRPSLVLILGDHQPPGFRSLEGHRETTDVPLHVLSNRPELLAPFAGMPDGLVPNPDFPRLRTEEFLGYFVEAFGVER